LHSAPTIISVIISRRMTSVAYHTHERANHYIQNVSWKIWTEQRSWKLFDYVKLNLKVIYQSVDWICVFEDRDQWRAFVHRNQIRIPQNDGNVLTGKRNIIAQQAFSTLDVAS
jgi:hypothetical protein